MTNLTRGSKRRILMTVCVLLAGLSAAAATPQRTVDDFGAVGDGETDDTAAILEAVAAGDGSLVFGRGVYRITAPIVIALEEHGYMSVSGDAGATQLLMDGAGPALHIIGTHGGTANPRSVQPEVWQRERMPLVRDLEIVGAHEAAEGIRLEKTMQAVITRVLIRNCLHGIRLINRNRNLIVSDSHLYENHDTGIFFDDVNLHQVNIIGNHISYSGRSAILVRDGEIRNIQITGNDIEYNHNVPEDAADILFDTREGTLREFTITGNTIQAVPSDNGANVRIIGRASECADQSGLGAITGNLIGSQTITVDLQHTRGVTVTGNSLYSAAEWSVRARNCRNITVSGNTVDYNPGREDQMRDGFLFEECDGVTVSGNTLVDCRAGDDAQGGAVTVRNSRNVLIGNNVIVNPAIRGIDVRGSASCMIMGNIVTDTRDEPVMRRAIAVDDASTDCIVADNLVPE